MTMRYVLTHFFSKGVLTRKEYFFAVLVISLFNMLIDFPLSFLLGQYSVYVRGLLNITLFLIVTYKRIKAITKHTILVVFLMLLCLPFNYFIGLIIFILPTNWTENRYVNSDLERTTNKINELAECKSDKLDVYVTHLLNLYKSHFGKHSKETEDIRNVLSLKFNKKYK